MNLQKAEGVSKCQLQAMKLTKTKKWIAALACVMLTACQNPYLAQMQATEAAYLRGDITRSEYNTRMRGLQAQSQAWSQQNDANLRMAGMAVGAAAAIGSAAIIAESNEDIAHAINNSNNNNKKGGGGGGGHSSGGNKPSGGGGGGGKKRPPPR